MNQTSDQCPMCESGPATSGRVERNWLSHQDCPACGTFLPRPGQRDRARHRLWSSRMRSFLRVYTEPATGAFILRDDICDGFYL